MGDKLSTTNPGSTDIMDKMKMVSQTEDPFFGKIDIFHFTEPPYEYLMSHKKAYVNDRPRLEKDLSLMRQIKNIEHPNLAKIYHSQIREDEQLCIKSSILYTYTNYYNFTLKRAIEKKKYTKHSFSEGDLIYITKSLVNFALELKKYGISKGTYRSQEIFLSPEGHVKLFLFNIDQENRHSCYYTVLSEKERLLEYLLAPEQLASLRNLELETGFDQYKADLFAIGLVIVELITLDHAKFYYNYEQLEFMSDKIQFVLANFAMSRYSEEFVGIIRKMLEPDPQRRVSLEETNERLVEILQRGKQKMVYCIRLEADPNQATERTADPPKKRIMLSRIATKLAPKPIQMFSTTSTTKPMYSTQSSVKKEHGGN